MPHIELQLHTDLLAPKSELQLPAGVRVVYVREGDAVVRSGRQAAGLAANNAWHGSGEVRIAGGLTGAALWRWELAPEESGSGTPATAAGVTSSLTLSHP